MKFSEEIKPLDKKDFGVGSIVIFKQKVFEAPYEPYYDFYQNETFQIIGYHPDSNAHDHIELKCISDPSIKVLGYVHLDEVEYGTYE